MQVKVDNIKLQIQDAMQDIKENPRVNVVEEIMTRLAYECFEAGKTQKRQQMNHQLRTAHRHLRNAEKKLEQLHSQMSFVNIDVYEGNEE